MLSAQLTRSTGLTRTVDSIRASVDRLASRLPEGEEAAVLVDFLEDDLREGLDAVAEVEGHFTDLLDALREKQLSAMSLVDLAEDFRVLNRLEYLSVVVAQLRKRLLKAAGELQEKK